jgi:two-component system chemotaxis response regulator CheB
MILEPDGRARLETDESAEYAPSIDLTMQSAADCYGENAVGVLLTGMGTDGARGLGVIRRRGGMTLAQDPESCVVAGMPGAAIQQGVVEYVGQPADLARKIRAKLLAATGEPAHA